TPEYEPAELFNTCCSSPTVLIGPASNSEPATRLFDRPPYRCGDLPIGGYSQCSRNLPPFRFIKGFLSCRACRRSSITAMPSQKSSEGLHRERFRRSRLLRLGLSGYDRIAPRFLLLFPVKARSKCPQAAEHVPKIGLAPHALRASCRQGRTGCKNSKLVLTGRVRQ